MISLTLPDFARDWPHVTDILGVRWGENDFRDSQGGTEAFHAKGQLGREFHDLVHAHILHKDADIWPSESIINRFNAWKRWWDSNGGKVIAVEFPVWSETYQYQGAPDLLYLGPDGLVLPDWKNSAVLLPTYPLQLAAYKFALIDMFKHGVFEAYGYTLDEFKAMKRVLVKIDEEKADPKTLPEKQYPLDLAAFTQLRAASQYLKVKFKLRQED